MPTQCSEFVRTIAERGFLHQCTDLSGLDGLASEQLVTGYIGFDCTAPSLHVGSLVPIMLLRWMQRTGHKPIVLFGGGTSKVGDPSGKDESRKLLSHQEISDNMSGIRKVFERFIDFGDAENDAIEVDNGDWLDHLGYISFLRDYGRHVSVNRMLSMDAVKNRLDREQNLSFLEFNYMVLQAYDFLELSRRYNCILQMGGSDQWGNIIAGVELGRRIDGRTLFGLTAPLITTASGAKMGKTAAGAVWLNDTMLSPYAYWQFWRDTDDGDVGRFLGLFTELPLSEILRLEALQGSELNAAKVILANEATRLCHGERAAEAAQKTAEQTFAVGGMGDNLPSIAVTKQELEDGVAVFDLFRKAGLAESNSEARRLIKGGGGRLNDHVIASETYALSVSDFNEDGLLKLSAGKKRHVIVRIHGEHN